MEKHNGTTKRKGWKIGKTGKYYPTIEELVKKEKYFQIPFVGSKAIPYDPNKTAAEHHSLYASDESLANLMDQGRKKCKALELQKTLKRTNDPRILFANFKELCGEQSKLEDALKKIRDASKQNNVDNSVVIRDIVSLLQSLNHEIEQYKPYIAKAE
jgi:hypothetical protein